MKKIATLLFLVLLLISGVFGLTQKVYATTSGPNSPGTMADDATVGTVAWSNPDNAKTSNDVYAVAGSSGTVSHYLKATNFGFSIPVGATINGILAEVERKASGPDSTSQDNQVKIVKSDGTIGTTDKADTVTNWPTTDAYKSYGSSSDLWGETWTPSDINDVDFGVVLSAKIQGASVRNIDHIRITVSYTLNAPTITTPTNTSVIGSSATLGGNVTSDGGSAVTGRGVCVGTSANPALGGNCFSTSGTTGVFTVSATGLTQGTLYHYRAYATNSIGTSYTSDDTFTTLALNNYLVTIITPQTAGVCATGTNTVTARDSTNATITTDSSTVNMTSSGTGVTFYTTNGCSSSTTQYTLSSGVSNIYYKTNLAQNFTITATKASSTETGTSSSITVNPGSQTRLIVTLPGETFTAGSGNSGSVTNQVAGTQFTITKITATDDYFNIVSGYSGSKTLVYSGPSSAGGAPSYTTSVSFTSGQSTTALLTTLNYPETTTITVTDGGSYGYASSSLLVKSPSVTVGHGTVIRSGVKIQSQ